MQVMLSGGPFDGLRYAVRTNFKSTLHIADPALPPSTIDPRETPIESFRYRPTRRRTDDDLVIYDFVEAPKAADPTSN